MLLYLRCAIQHIGELNMETQTVNLPVAVPRKHPAPTQCEPEVEELVAWEEDGGCEATDGCWVEPDGICEHGHQSWLLHLGYI